MTNTPKLQYISVGGTEVLVNKIKENTSAISSEATTARAAEKANADAIAVLNGDSNTEGSVKKAIKDLINAAPEELDTLGEIAEQLNNNENATAAINNVITKHVADAEKQRAELAKLIQANTESIKNNQTAIDANKLTKITWADLKAKRDAGELIPGVQYRIIDYQCTTTQDKTESAGHQFDIIVIADSENKLNEVARAIRHDGDTYFSNCNLAAWKIWYCLDNDTSRFAWADATNGKGVIYRMIDEYNNDCPYDFKNIQFKRYKITAAKSSDLVGTYLGVEDNSNIGISIDSNDSKMFYTFSYLGELDDLTDYSGEVLQDASIVGNTLKPDVGSPYGVYNNSIKQFYDNNITSEETIQGLNSIVFLTLIVNGDGEYYGCHSNSFGNDCYYNSFGNDCSSNSFGDSCNSNSFGNDCDFNSFGNDCYYNSFGDSCYSNSFGDSCYYNSFGNYCQYNSFGNYCYYNSFGNYCYSNSFGNGCHSNSFDDSCYYNSFGNYCYSNSFGNECHSNSFGNSCHSNSFGTGCSSNSFGNECSSNSFGNNCFYNSFGNYCSHNKLNNQYIYNKFENGIQYVEFSDNGTHSDYVQNYHIKQGMVFTSPTKHTITAKTGLTYELSVAKQSDGTVVEYCEADLLKDNTVEYTAADVEALFA